MEYHCSKCGEDCDPITEDNSFDWEMGSQRGTVRGASVVSDCCEADVLDIKDDVVDGRKLEEYEFEPDF